MININPLHLTQSNYNIKSDKANQSSAVTNSINSNNINNLNYFNKSLISFTGLSYYQTLNDNYFNLPIDKSTGKPFQPDIYQKAAAENLYKGNDVIVTAPTGTGKTAIAHYIINKNLEEGKKTFYTAPLKALSNDKIREFQKIYGAENVGLLTGDKKVNKDAPIVIMTTEVYRNMAINDALKEANPMLDDLKTVVFDELHYLGDEDRGSVWEQAIMYTNPDTQILSLSGTMANPEKIADWMASTKGHSLSEKVTPDENYRARRNADVHTVLVQVPSSKRHVPLEFNILNAKPQESHGGGGGSKAGRRRAKKQAHLMAQSDSAGPSKEAYLSTVEKLQKEDKLPAIFFIFSKKEGRSTLSYLKENGPKLTSGREEDEIMDTIKRFEQDGKYLGESLDVVALKRGYALHNAGMLPDQKELVEELFQKKLVKAVISTETLSAGINMPTRTTVICGLRKPSDNPDGTDRKRYISPNLFHQMAGRAGRRGIDKIGYVYCLACNKSQANRFQDLINTPANDVESHFKMDYSFVATAQETYKDKKLLKDLFKKSLYAYDSDATQRNINAKKMVSEFEAKENTLKAYNYIDNEGNLTKKGMLLSKINGYEQIPVLEAITGKVFEGMNAVQLAGYAAGLASLDSVPKSDLPPDSPIFEFNDDYEFGNSVTNMLMKIPEYNKNIYEKEGNRELRSDSSAIKHVYTWAELNKERDDSYANWKELYSGDLRKSIRDEGTLFREIVTTVDLLKQMDEIAQEGIAISKRERDIDYYTNLSSKIRQSIELINQPPAKDDVLLFDEGNK